MAKKIRAGVVGAGWPACQHMKSYKVVPDVELVALCDLDEARLGKIADEYGVPERYTSYDTMLEKAGLDVVSVCTPNALHAEMSVKAMKLGKHVLCEKPMAASVAAAREMLAVSAQTGSVLMIAHQRRFAPQSQYLKKLIDSGTLGEIYHVRTWWVRRRGVPGMGGWFTQKHLSGGGALIDIGVHVLDLALWLIDFPRPLSVAGSWGSRFGVHGRGSWRAQDVARAKAAFDVDDYAFAQVSFGGGRSLQLQCSWAGNIKQDEMNIEVWGEKGGARLFPLEIYTEEDGVQQDITPKLRDNNQFDEEIRSFVEAAGNGTRPACPPEEGLRTMEIIEMIYRAGSGDSGVAVATEELEGSPAV